MGEITEHIPKYIQISSEEIVFKHNKEQCVQGDAKKKGRVIVVSAPSGAGKTTLLNYIREKIPELEYSISATTRQPRPHEIDGVHYHFFNVEQFKTHIIQKKFAEWQIVHGNYYGTPRSNIESAIDHGRNIVMDIDVYGKKELDALYPDTVGILILPPSMEVLEKRLRERGTDDEATIRTRLTNATNEMKFAQIEGKYEYTVINDNLERARNEFFAVVRSIIAG